MLDRLAEFVEAAKRYGREAGAEWGESFKDSPPAHFLTFLVGAALAAVAIWVL